MFLDGILKGLVLWLYGLILEGVEYMADSLLSIFSLDLAYFEAYAPVVKDIQNIVIAVGWALLIGNLVDFAFVLWYLAVYPLHGFMEQLGKGAVLVCFAGRL